eukprot:6468596-Ditylum_brightwellii.AAC.1
MSEEQEALTNAKKELQKVKDNMEKEEDFIKKMSFSSKKDIVYLNVRGTFMIVKRSTLRIIKDSKLERQFDDSAWTDQHPDKLSSKKWSYEEVT